MEPIEFLEHSFVRWDGIVRELDAKIEAVNGNAALLTHELFDEYANAVATRRRIRNAIDTVRDAMAESPKLFKES